MRDELQTRDDLVMRDDVEMSGEEYNGWRVSNDWHKGSRKSELSTRVTCFKFEMLTYHGRRKFEDLISKKNAPSF